MRPAHEHRPLRSPASKSLSHCQSNFRCAAIRSAVIRRTKCNQQRNRLRKVLQPITLCRDSPFMINGNVIETHERGRFQRLVENLAGRFTEARRENSCAFLSSMRAAIDCCWALCLISLRRAVLAPPISRRSQLQFPRDRRRL